MERSPARARRHCALKHGPGTPLGSRKSDHAGFYGVGTSQALAAIMDDQQFTKEALEMTEPQSNETPHTGSAPVPLSNNQVTQGESAKPRALVVDDDAEIVESIRYALEANGFEVTVARDGNQGLAIAEKTLPDLLVLDMMMPMRSGFLVLEQLRRDGNNRMRVIMVTGNEGNRHQQYAELLGVDDYIRKPFPMDRLIESALRLVAKKSDE
jgi:CheY-like chemotaxis protein